MGSLNPLCKSPGSTLTMCSCGDQQCGTEQTCSDSECVCASEGQEVCDDSCTDLKTDSKNCGECGNTVGFCGPLSLDPLPIALGLPISRLLNLYFALDRAYGLT